MSIKYPIAELFHSPQGEGTFTGVPMFFIRLAGCNVGKFEPSAVLEDPKLKVLRNTYSAHSICTTSDGQKLLCDTDYSKKMELTAQELYAKETHNYEYICISGGEPYLHNLWELSRVFQYYHVHIETSGTKPIVTEFVDWITCSPKQGFMPQYLESDDVDEWKFLVGEKFDEKYVQDFAAKDVHRRPIYIQPIGDVHTHQRANIKRCLDIIHRNPSWRMSVQLHKWLEVR